MDKLTTALPEEAIEFLVVEFKYEEAVAAWEAIADNQKLRETYEKVVFPLACERLRLMTSDRSPARLGFIPVGTQPYSPILASIATECQEYVLLHTSLTRDIASTVAKSIGGQVSIRNIGERHNSVRLAHVICEELVRRGGIRPQDVFVDVTGGRKATSASLGAIANIEGFRVGYVEGDASKRPPYFINERFVHVSNVRPIVAKPSRLLALEALKSGLFAEAERIIEPIAEGDYRQDLDIFIRFLAKGMIQFSKGRFSEALSGLYDAKCPMHSVKAIRSLDKFIRAFEESASQLPVARQRYWGLLTGYPVDLSAPLDKKLRVPEYIARIATLEEKEFYG